MYRVCHWISWVKPSAIHALLGTTVILTNDRQRTEPWPNPWSHPLPTFLYSKESKSITVTFHSDPLISYKWSRPESEWKGKQFILAARTMGSPRGLNFEEVARWAPENSQSTGKWNSYSGRFEANAWYNLGVEENGTNMADLRRMTWELESI
jgi:hypothetical protein